MTAPSPGQLGEITARIAANAHTLTTHLALALAALDTNRNGYPANTLAGGSGTPSHGGETTTSTERAALTPDRARHDQDTLTRAILTAERALDQATALVTSWAPLANPARPAGCRSCARARHHYEPVHSRGLCRWCAEFTNTYLEYLPIDELDLVPLALLEIHHGGHRITTADLTRHLTDFTP